MTSCPDEFAGEMLRLSRQADLPMLRYLPSMTEEELLAYTKQSVIQFLECFVENRTTEFVEESLDRWRQNQLKLVGREQISPRDISLIGYIRKQAFLTFLPRYTQDPLQLVGIIREIDDYALYLQTRGTEMYVGLMREAIEEQHYFNEKLAGTSPGVIYVFDLLQQQEVYSNRKVEQLLGYSHEELLEMGSRYLEIVQHPEDLPRVLAHFQAFDTAADGEVRTFEHRLKAKSGEYRWIRNYESVFRRTTDGRPWQIIGIGLNIDNEKKNTEQLLNREAQLQETVRLYHQTQALTHIGNWTWDIATNQVHWSDELFRIYGLEPQSEVISFERFLRLVHPDDRETVTRQVRESLETGQPNDFHHRIVRVDGTVRVLHARGGVILDDNHRPVRMLGTGQDVTEPWTAGQELRQQQIFIQKIADAAPSLITTFNVRTGRYLFVSQGIEKILGYSARQVLDEGIGFLMTLIHPDDLTRIMEENQRAVEEANRVQGAGTDEKVVEFRYRMRNRSGQYLWLQTFGTVFDRTPDGLVEHILNISLDITGQVEAEQKVEEKQRRLEQSNASLREFAYIASHDLKEPLRKISTFGDRILQTQHEKMDADGQLYLSKIIDAAVRMHAMIGDVLSVSQLTSEQSQETVSLQGILDETLQALDHQIEQKAAVIRSDGLPQVPVVPTQFRQVFLNLLTNALKFARTDRPPEIRVTHRYLHPGEETPYGLLSGRRYLQLCFSDNGIGFDNRFAGKIFAIFQRLHGRNEFEGTGIGLAICKKIVENHGGVITADGSPDRGATFTIVLPA
ncbi:PAS domain-containing sensor histidine kinase [Larkinella soli]|uniref:PAS domain-containing sensor histidine kinase n=1 Tax=Larkinella soli TaxID=1770527 RepID=UPI000FFC97AC|nr:PAS domain-containing protein [Larkinella soli]